MKTISSSLLIAALGTFLGCSSLRTSEQEVPSVSGKWRIEQTNSGGQKFTGTLNLIQAGSEFSGSVIWNDRGSASITNGTVSGGIISFVVEYDGGLKGKYYATLGTTHKTLFDGATVTIQGGNDSGMWSATLIEE